MKNFILFLLIIIFMGSCASKKDVIYYQDIDETELQDVSSVKPKTEIQISDIVKVDIQTLNPESAIPYNKSSGMGQGGGGGAGMQQGMIALQGYIVDEYGIIELPVVGKVKIVGLSLQQAEDKIKSELSGYLKDPYVSIRIVNYKYTVQGEVKAPGTYETFDPNLTLLQALGNAGDLSINGRRDNIMIVRTLGDERIVRRIDLTQSDWMNSPYYFVQQNDVIYVEPNNPKVKTAGFVGTVGALTGVISFLLTVTLIFTR